MKKKVIKRDINALSTGAKMAKLLLSAFSTQNKTTLTMLFRDKLH